MCDCLMCNVLRRERDEHWDGEVSAIVEANRLRGMVNYALDGPPESVALLLKDALDDCHGETDYRDIRSARERAEARVAELTGLLSGHSVMDAARPIFAEGYAACLGDLRRRAGLSGPSAGRLAAEAVARDAKQERIDELEKAVHDALRFGALLEPRLFADGYVTCAKEILHNAGLDKPEPAKTPTFRDCPNCQCHAVDADGYCHNCEGVSLPTGECPQCGSPTWRKATPPAPRLWRCEECGHVACGCCLAEDAERVVCQNCGGSLATGTFTPDQEDAK